MPSELSSVLSAKGKAYCETTTVHGFAYWVSAPRFLEKVFWVLVVVTGFSLASMIVHAAVVDWMDNPASTGIQTFSKVS